MVKGAKRFGKYPKKNLQFLSGQAETFPGRPEAFAMRLSSRE